jgi:hypothetical protein
MLPLARLFTVTTDTKIKWSLEARGSPPPQVIPLSLVAADGLCFWFWGGRTDMTTTSTATRFLLAALTLAVTGFLFINFRRGLDAWLWMMYRKTDWTPDAWGALALFIAMGLLVTGWTCAHWFGFVVLSKPETSPKVTRMCGLLMLAADLYIRITSTMLPGRSTSAIAVMFIPIFVGIPGLVVYVIADRVTRPKQGA